VAGSRVVPQQKGQNTGLSQPNSIFYANSRSGKEELRMLQVSSVVDFLIRKVFKLLPLGNINF